MIERDMRLRFEQLLSRVLRYPHAVALLAHFEEKTEAEFLADMLTATALGVIRDQPTRNRPAPSKN